MDLTLGYFSSELILISFYFFYFGIEKLDKTDLSNSVPPVVMSAFKHFLAVSFCHSSTYTLALRPKLKISVVKYFIWISFSVSPLIFIRIAGESFAWYFPIYSLFHILGLLYYFLPEMKSFLFEPHFYKVSVGIALFPLVYYWSRAESLGWYVSIFISNSVINLMLTLAVLSEEQTCLLAHYFAVSSVFFFGGKSKYFPALVVLIGFFTSITWAAASRDERFQKWLPASEENGNFVKLKKILRKNGKVIEFAIGMGATILFQNFFRLTSFDEVVAFLYLAVAWLANLALLLASNDLGVFNFFLSNVIVGCTVSEFGLRGTTWLAYGACVLLFILRLKLESLCMVIKGEDQGTVVVWRDQDNSE